MKVFEIRYDQMIKLCLVPLKLSESFLFGVKNFLVFMLLSVTVELNLAISV